MGESLRSEGRFPGPACECHAHAYHPPLPRRRAGPSAFRTPCGRCFRSSPACPPTGFAPAATFLDLGFDSLSLTQAATAVSRKFGVRVTFRTLLEEASTVSMLAAWLDEKLPPEALPAPVPAAPAPAAPAPTIETAPSTPMPSTLMERVIAEQLQVMAKQLDLLRGGAAPTPLAPAPLAAPGGSRRACAPRACACPGGVWTVQAH